MLSVPRFTFALGTYTKLQFQVSNLDSADSLLTLATSSGYSNFPSLMLFANVNSRSCPHPESNMTIPSSLWPAYVKKNVPYGNDLTSSSSSEQRPSSSLAQNPKSDDDNQQPDQFATPMDVCPREPTASNGILDAVFGHVSNNIEMHAAQSQPGSRLPDNRSINNLERLNARDDVQMPSMSNPVAIPATTGSSVPDDRHAMPINMLTTSGALDVQMLLRTMERGQHSHYPSAETRSWEVPFLQGWLMGQNHTDLHPALVNNNVLEDISLSGTAAINNMTSESQHMHNFGHPGPTQSIPITAGSSRGSNRRYALCSIPGVMSSLLGPQIDESELHTASLGVGSELAASLLAVGSTELPCTVKLKIWRHDINSPCAYLEPKACCLTISHAVLCRCINALLFPLRLTRFYIS
jgi:activating molecule in BECN1-regulated autophagy protein 1